MNRDKTRTKWEVYWPIPVATLKRRQSMPSLTLCLPLMTSYLNFLILLAGQLRGKNNAFPRAKLGTAYCNWPRQYGGATSRAQHRSTALAVDVVFELFDDELLLGNNRLDEIADRDDADQPPAVHDRQVPNPPLGYDGHAFLNALVQASTDHVGCHDLPDCGLVGRTALENDFTGVVPF